MINLKILPLKGNDDKLRTGDEPKNPNAKIIGGTSADLGDLPYQCFLQIETSQNFIHCGCSIVETNWVITSTNCAENG